jgi:hypothetical protein
VTWGRAWNMLKHEVMAAVEWHDNGPQDLVTVSLRIQIAIDKMQLCSLSIAYACPYHNPTSNMGHSAHNVDINKPLAHTTPCCLPSAWYRWNQDSSVKSTLLQCARGHQRWEFAHWSRLGCPTAIKTLVRTMKQFVHKFFGCANPQFH